MTLIYALARFFPYWAIPLAIVLADIGLYFRRKRHSAQWAFWASAAICAGLSVLWLVYRGDLNSDRWLDSVFK